VRIYAQEDLRAYGAAHFLRRTMGRPTLTIACFSLLLAGTAVGAAQVVEDETLAPRVIVLANSSSEESTRLAKHYAAKRAIPVENIVALPMSQAESVRWRDFIDSVYQPLQDELLKRGWIDGVQTALTDKTGRKRHVLTGHRMAYLVVCRGVPLKIEHDPALYEENLPHTRRGEFQTNAGAVDAELSLLAASGYPINALVPNPLFQQLRPRQFDLRKIVKVSRLDGPSYDAAARLVDHALEAERRGLIGRAYVDIGGPHAQGDEWMNNVADQLSAANFDVSVDRSPSTLGGEARFDAPVLYFGWYAGDVNGPFVKPGFEFPPGAIALHIHSFSARTMNSTSEGWTSPLVARGVTGTFGNVFEPYLVFTHYPHLVLRALLRGQNFGDATFFALPAVSWQAVAIGDPLYRPFAFSFAQQWERRAELPRNLAGYVVARELRRMNKEGQTDAAIQSGISEYKLRPSWPLALELARLLKDANRPDELQRIFAGEALPPVERADVPAISELTEVLSGALPPQESVRVFQLLLGIKPLAREARLALLPRAEKIAEAAQELDLAAQWRRELAALSSGAL
jgi:uncharacterized protein (TIGR03790 family)